jgi:hypothetical protein
LVASFGSYFFIFFLAVLRIKPRVSDVLGKHSASELC